MDKFSDIDKAYKQYSDFQFRRLHYCKLFSLHFSIRNFGMFLCCWGTSSSWLLLGTL